MHIILLSRGHGAARSLNLDLRLIVAVAVLLLVGTLVGGVALGSWLTPTVRSPEPDGAARVLSEKLAQLTASRQDAQRQLDAFSAHVADLQVRLTRLDVLGARLTELADVDASEFDFSLAAGRGGPEEPLEGDEYRVPSFAETLDELTLQLDSREQQLAVLEQVLAHRRVLEAESLSRSPVQNGFISSPFGPRTDPISGRVSMHKGMDFAGEPGSDVLAVAAGVVSRSERAPGYGNVVEIRHAEGYATVYGHNQSNLVQVGDLVQPGQVIAKLGSTGRSTGPHLHFEVRKDGRPVNPAAFLARAESEK
ncbi:M23 family metallopeptidase [Stutzerimonas azotifigens]|uniref:M23 family metallopeptidase n=1 Tax=Stutzerimonas azotifigens TaxID=291995 RepID=UPI000427CFA7|nr:M23 family metallopeptidase [Stutzerimonas azotifigens]